MQPPFQDPRTARACTSTRQTATAPTAPPTSGCRLWCPLLRRVWQSAQSMQARWCGGTAARGTAWSFCTATPRKSWTLLWLRRWSGWREQQMQWRQPSSGGSGWRQRACTPRPQARCLCWKGPASRRALCRCPKMEMTAATAVTRRRTAPTGRPSSDRSAAAAGGQPPSGDAAVAAHAGMLRLHRAWGLRASGHAWAALR